jgi:hypothetical protein
MNVWSASDAGSLEMFQCCLAVDVELLGELCDRSTTLVAKNELLHHVIR